VYSLYLQYTAAATYQLYSFCFDPTRDRTHALPHSNPLTCTITCSFLEMITVSIKEKQNSIKILHNWIEAQNWMHYEI
jgi:hypothetical protein